MKTIKYIIMSVVMLFGFASCNDYLEVYEENVEPTDLYWSSKADVEATLSAGYWYLRNSVETYLIPWGELRAGCLFNRSGSPLQTYQIKSTTNITTWSPMYQIINSANLVLKNCDLARSNDATYTQEEMNSHKCEAYWLRALAYFYIVRNWRDAPLFTEPFETDEISYNVAKSSETEIIAQIKADLEEAIRLGAAKTSFNTTWETKGRATIWAIYALMTDVCMWNSDFEQAINYANLILNATASDAPRFMKTA
ncbi:MAG: RagB/SusD family nutrient uptake outer membrane protein, partial [Prevotella sp.]|nr:RagB/SusD family nutrient uptake outer membrane protein [Prevotella sp.]